VLGLPSLMISLPSDNSTMQRLDLYHYSAPLIPAIMLTTVAGTRRATTLLTRLGIIYGRAVALVVALLLTSPLTRWFRYVGAGSPPDPGA